MPAVRLALRDVNRSPHILPNIHLRMHWNNTACNPGVGLRSFFELVHNVPKKVILFGGACSKVTDQIVKAARHWSLVQVTYADTHPMFTARSFPHFFRVVPSENQFNQPRLSLLKQYNWTRVGTLYQNEAKYSLAHNDLLRQLKNKGFQVILSQSFNDELTGQLEGFRDNDIRIILGNFNESWARTVFCDAFHKALYGEKIQWLIVGMYEAHWWANPQDGLNCTTEQILAALQGTMVMEIQPISSCSQAARSEGLCRRTISSKTSEQYEAEYRNASRVTAIKHNITNHPYSRFHGYAYDGIWAIARAIEAVETESSATNESLAQFEYKDAKWERRFIRALNHTAFEGVTGPVQFKNNSRRGNVLINQIVGEEERCIGEYSGVTRTLHMERCNPVTWPMFNNKSRPPKDRTFKRVEQTRVEPTVYTILCVTASCGIVLGATFLAVNIKYRHQKQIKMSSPNLNNVIIIGCILCYSSVIILGLDSSITSTDAFPYICTAKAWVLMAGFTLSFGSMFSKTWRVHSIFTNVQLNKKVMKDSQLFLVVAVLLAMDITIMTTWQLADPFYRETRELKPYPQYGDADFIIIPQNEMCKSHRMNVFIGVIYAYKGLLLLFGAFLAWETRNVQIPALNDSKYVGMSVYNVTIMCVLGVAISAVLNEHPNASFVLISVFIIFCTTGTLCLVFVPKLIELRQDPQGMRKAPSGISVGKEKLKFKNDLTSLDDKLRIANKVNNKYLELGGEKSESLEELLREAGEEAELVLENGLASSLAKKKEAHVSFAASGGGSDSLTDEVVEGAEASSSASDRTPQADSGLGSSHSDKRSDDGPRPNLSPTPSSDSPRRHLVSSVENLPSSQRISPPRCKAIAQQMLYEAQRDLTPLVQPSNALLEEEREANSPSTENPMDFPLSSREFSTRSLDLSSTSSLSSGSRSLYCEERAYYRREVESREDQATQTDDETDESPRRRAIRPTNFGHSDIGANFSEQVRSAEVLNKQRALQNPLSPTQEALNRGTLALKAVSVKHRSSNQINGLHSTNIVPIFQKLLEERSPVSLSSPPAKSCPNIAVRCDIVEYL